MATAPKTGFIFSEKYFDHRPSASHPESPDRLKWIVDQLRRDGVWKDLVVYEPVSADLQCVKYSHSDEYIRRVQKTCTSNIRTLDTPDVEISSQSYAVALLAVGGVIEAVDLVATQQLRNCFCCVRPPGHHALRNRALGFCIFNNIAIAAKYLQKHYGDKKIMIIDWDVHHGNGTQEAFYDEPSVFYLSIHQYPHYPGTGADSEVGTGTGKGYTLNIPMPPYSADDDYLRVFHQQVVPVAERFKPDWVLISAGFDAYEYDPLSSVRLSSSCFGDLTKIVVDIAESFADGRLVSVLEGGYHPGGLALSVERHIQNLMA